jgi:signal transduction histidine kinase
VIESGRFELRPSSFAIADLIREVAEELEPMARAKAIDLALVEPGDRLYAWADRDKITQVLTNLMTNAVKFTPNGGVVTVHAMPAETGRWLRVSVSDTGAGIPELERQRIFDEFYQIAQPGQQKSQGVGLGLAICKKLIDMHGGVIEVESIPENGSTFSFTLPQSRAAASASSTIFH